MSLDFTPTLRTGILIDSTLQIIRFESPLTAFVASVLAMALSSACSWAGIVTYVDLTGATAGGRVWDVTTVQQVGEANISNQAHAALWSGRAASFTDLTPAFAFSAILNGTSGNQQVGVVWQLNTMPHAGLWSGSAGSFVDIHPAGAYASEAHATSGSRQVGGTYVGPTTLHASLWSGSAASFVDLHPASAYYSIAVAISGNQQGGYAKFGGEYGSEHAGIWSGSAASFLDLNPAGFQNSRVNAMAGIQQAGHASNNAHHAGIWYGSAASFVDLNPPGAFGSDIEATTGDFQAGSAVFESGYRHAVLWSGSASSFLDLHASLEPDFHISYATSIATNGLTILIGGYARNTADLSERPILWTIAVPEPQSMAMALLFLGSSIFWRLRLTSRQVILGKS